MHEPRSSHADLILTARVLDAAARDRLNGYLSALDGAFGDAVEGVYLVGSVALGDYLPGLSDLDVFVMTHEPLTVRQLEAASRLSDEFFRPLFVDALYVPRGRVGTACVVRSRFANEMAGVFRRGGSHECLVTWATLAQCGVTVRGPEASTLNAAPDPRELRDWAQRELEAVWRRLASFCLRGFAAKDPDDETDEMLIRHLATAPARMHWIVRTGTVIAKTAAIDYAADLHPECAQVLSRAKARWLGDRSVRFTARDCLALAEVVAALCDSVAEGPMAEGLPGAAIAGPAESTRPADVGKPGVG